MKMIVTLKDSNNRNFSRLLSQNYLLRLRQGISILLFISLCACSAARDHQLFVTKTSVGIDLDPSPPTISIAYDRKEGVLRKPL